MGTKVPLVAHQFGKRVILGEACVSFADGELLITGTITHNLNFARNLLGDTVGEVSLGPLIASGSADMSWAEAQGYHTTLGHDRFKLQAEELGKNETFIYNVCANLRCDQKDG